MPKKDTEARLKDKREALFHSESFLRAVLDGAGEAVVVCDEKGSIIRANPAAEALAGGPVLHQPLDDMYPIHMISENPDEVRAPFSVSRVLSGERFQGKEAVLTTPELDDRYFLLSATPLQSGDRVKGCVLILTEMTDHKKLEMALDAERERLVVTLLSIGDGVITTDVQGRIELMNPVAETLTGWRQKEARGRALQEVFRIINEKTREPCENPVKKVLESGRVIGLANHTLLIHKNGEEIPIRNSGAPIRLTDGEIIGVILVFQDDRHGRAMQQELRDAKELLERTFASLRDAVFVVDAGTRCITQCNKVVEHVFGYTEKEVLGRNTEFLHTDHQNYVRFGEKLFPALDAKGVFTSEFQMRKKNGDIFVSEHTVTEFRDHEGRRILVVSVVRDITEKVQAEKALRESEEKFKSLVNNLNVGVYRNTPGPRGKFIEVNSAMAEMFGYESREEVMARSVSDFYMNPADRNRFSEKLLKSQSVKNEELQLKKKDGTLLIASVSSVAVPDEKGNTKYFDNIVEDITLTRQLQAQLQQAQKMESVGRLAGGVAHDFNNKLTTMLGYTELAMGRLDPSDALYGDLKQILEAGKQSANIVRQLLAFARKQTISPEVMYLNDTVGGMLKMLRRLIGEDIDLAWEPGANLWLINMDPTQIDQILANLCVNAKDAIGGGGKVTVKTKNVVLDQAYCAGRAGFVPGEYVMLAVRDDGIGMDKETLENVFEPFFTTKEVGKGTGLGLATVYGIVKQNNGFINVYSEPGRGTTVKIYLPRHKGEADGKAKAVESEIPRGHGESVLIVEDEKTVLQLGKRMLERLGYTVMAMESPVEAVERVREHTGDIHLLMTDVVMPGMSGKELTGEIQKIRPDIKTLFMSGYTANAIAHQGVLDEGVHFIQKPFGMESLARKVREALDGR